MPRRSAAPGHNPHICFVAPSIYPVFSGNRSIPFAGGAEVQQSFLARGLRDAGHRVTIVTNTNTRPTEFELEGIRIIPIIRSEREIPIVRNVYPRLTSVWNALARANADVYFQRCAGANAFVTGLFAKARKRIFIYSGAHDLDFRRNQTWKLFQRRGGWRDRQLYQLGLPMADGIVAQHSEQVRDCLQWYGREAVEILNCYAPPPEATTAHDGVVLWVATVKSWKRPELFLEIARGLPHLRFRMIGGPGQDKEADVYERTKAAAAELPNVEFMGFVPFADVEGHFNDARVFVNTSEYEGFPNTFLQSWARGVPTVSFVDCGSREGGRPVGFISKSTEEMRQTVSRLCEDNALRIAEGVRAREYFEARHSVAVAIERYRDLFERLLASKGRV